MISIIVPLFNHFEDLTVPFVKRLEDYTQGVDYELILVNNGSSDGTSDGIERLKKRYKNIKVVQSRTNTGFGGGNNLGYKVARGEYILFISNDVIIQKKGWLDILMKSCQERDGLYGQNYVDWNMLTAFRGVATPYIEGYLMFGTKKMFDEVLEDGDVFDESFGVAYFEDVDLSHRCALAGYPLIGINYLPVEHLRSKSSDRIDISAQTKKAQRHFQNKMMFSYLSVNNLKRIIFFSRSSYGFVDDDYEGKGVGGAEASLILLARELARKGYIVDIYNATKKTGKFNGVYYHNISEYRWWEYADVFVLFRTPERILRHVNAVHKIFWSCDQYTTGNWKKEVFPYVDSIIAISPYHKKYMEYIYGKQEHMRVIELGINAKDYEVSVEKKQGKLIFCSVPHRGLTHLSYLFTQIKREVPHATLTITSDYRLWGLDHPDNQKYYEEFAHREDVEFLGKVPRSELVKHQLEAEVMAYPCNYEECFCIAAMECIAAGATPVTTKLAALESTVGESGVLLSNMPGTPEYDKMFVQSVVGLLSKNDYRDKGRKRALSKYSWDKVSDTWIQLFSSLEKEKGGENMVTCESCEKKFKSSYLLGKHTASKHADKATVSEAEIANIPPVAEEQKYTQLLRFKLPIEVQINGVKYVGKEFDVSSDVVPGLIETAQGAYGKDILEL